jgi:Resolvase, N terminal domain
VQLAALWPVEAQQAAVAAFIAGKGDDAKLLASYLEIESGKRDDRPELAKTLDHARLTGATLLVAKLDRLPRDAHFLLGLQKAGVSSLPPTCPTRTSSRWESWLLSLNRNGRRSPAAPAKPSPQQDSRCRDQAKEAPRD